MSRALAARAANPAGSRLPERLYRERRIGRGAEDRRDFDRADRPAALGNPRDRPAGATAQIAAGAGSASHLLFKQLS